MYVCILTKCVPVKGQHHIFAHIHTYETQLMQIKLPVVRQSGQAVAIAGVHHRWHAFVSALSYAAATDICYC